MSLHEGYGRIDTEGRRRRELEERERQKAAKRAAITAQLEPALREAKGGSVAAMREATRLLAERHDITIDIREHMPAGAAAFASWRTRTITIPPITDATDSRRPCMRSGTSWRAPALAVNRTGRIHRSRAGITASGARWMPGSRR